MTHSKPMSGKKLLVADDSLTIQKVIRLALSHEGYDIQAVSDGAEALEQLMLFRPQVVLIDVSLPGRSAVEVKAFTDEKPELRDIRFVLMSSAFEQVDEAGVIKAGFHGRLTKPFDPAHLRKVLNEALATAVQESATPPDFPASWSSPSPAASAAADPAIPSRPAAAVTPPPFHPAPAGPAAAAPPSFSPPESGGAEADIRTLTQSTLKMAGLEDFEWTVNEGARKETAFQPFDLEPSLPPLPNMMAGSQPSRAPELTHSSAADSALTPRPVTLTSIEVPRPAVSAQDSASIETLVQQQVEAVLSRMSREMLPEIAERLIKQEIHRLLGDGP